MASILKQTTGSVIKSSDEAAFSGLASINLKDFVESGREQVDVAKSLATKIIADAKQQVEQLRIQVTQEAKAEGSRQAQKEFDQRVDQAARKIAATDSAALRESVQKLWQSESEWLAEYQKILATLAMEIAERVIGQKCDHDETIVLGWAKQAIDLTRTAKSIVVAVHPETLVRIGDQLEMLLRSSGAPEDARLEPDETVSINGVVVRQEGGKVDMQLRAQLDRLFANLS